MNKVPFKVLPMLFTFSIVQNMPYYQREYLQLACKYHLQRLSQNTLEFLDIRLNE